MADDSNQRTYRPNDTRAAPSAPPTNDPLAELARLIGQSDPFAESGRDSVRRATPATEPPASWAPPPAAPAYKSPPTAPVPRAPAANPYAANGAEPELPEMQALSTPAFGQPRFAAAPASGEGYPTTVEPQDYSGADEQNVNYADDAYFQDDQTAEHDVYDEAPPRRRVGVIAVAAVFALAVAGTAGAFGYRALFGASGSRVPPPVIKADTAPVKVVPSAASKDAQSSKLITDRVGSRQDEKIVPREEQPVDLKNTASLPIAPTQSAQQSAPMAPANGSGIVTAEPKKIHTITIRPDQVGLADTGASAPTALPPAQAPRADVAVAAPPPRPPAAPPRVVNPPVVAEANPEPAPPPPPEPRAAAPREPQAAPARNAASVGNAPLSLNPNAAPPRASAPTKTAAIAAPVPASSGGGYAVQVSSQRSEAEAEAAFRSMQAKFPNQLGGRQPMIHRVDLGAKGIYFRAMVGPFATGSEASQLCSSLKSAGGQCIIQKN